MNPGLVVVLVLLVAAVAVGLLVRSRRSNDGMASFRRQIDALSPEARRPVVDQVQSAAERRDDPASEAPTDVPSDPPSDAPSDPPSDTSDGSGSAETDVDDQGGARGA